MKKQIAILFATIFFCACSSSTAKNQSNSDNNEENTKNQLVQSFLEDTQVLTTTTVKYSIASFKEEAAKTADKTLNLTKENVSTFLEEGGKYKSCIVITGNHTVVKVLDFQDGQMSGSWGAKMPMAEGFIRKGGLNFKKNYLNNIIGIPDSQERVAYYFN